ncbi:Carbonic anhydrase 2 [Phocoenobacter uteri]|uniref:Carbonic anhydrase n=1 Tax=Phocoenobacter uteri TaxID=146806 RepID=A0A379CAR1_9PAST|nr:carbonate dehydratase [Phocoenobacter uteri]SUB58786.1 Carbonic anhydrase 2 [Phocoenobacter uteri]
MKSVEELFEQNHLWAVNMKKQQPDYFDAIAEQQKPQILWIGCSDSRVPAEKLLGLESGELFVHRNIANLVVHTDLNCLSVVEYAVDVLDIHHIIICGHTNCGGIQASLTEEDYGLVNNWLLHIKDIRTKYRTILDKLPPEKRTRTLVQLNVAEQVYNLGRSSVVRAAWERGKALSIHGWMYDVHDGYLNDQGVMATSQESLETTYQNAIAKLTAEVEEYVLSGVDIPEFEGKAKFD